jgi:hypothetical protein
MHISEITVLKIPRMPARCPALERCCSFALMQKNQKIKAVGKSDDFA